MCKRGVALVFLLTSVWLLGAARLTPAPAGPYRVDGNRILDGKGRPYLVRGTELPSLTLNPADIAGDGKEFGAFSPSSLISIRQRLNMNAVRLKITPDPSILRVERGQRYAGNRSGQRKGQIDKGVDKAFERFLCDTDGASAFHEIEVFPGEKPGAQRGLLHIQPLGCTVQTNQLSGFVGIHNGSKLTIDSDAVTWYCYRVMVTRSAVTKKREPQFRTYQQWAVEPTQPRQRQALANDAEIVAFALNAFKGTAAYKHLTALLRDLRKLQAETSESAEERRIKKINRGLTQYVFHPTVTRGGRQGRFGVIALSASSFIPTPANYIATTEADAALSLVRLHVMGDLGKVRLCEVCRERWLASTHSNYRFCSKDCREGFFQSQPDYHERKRRNQSKYRETLKLMGRKKE